MTLITRQNFTPFPVPDFAAQEEAALAAACLVTQVKTEDENAIAFKACQVLKAFLRRVEESRKEVKAPVLKLENDIDAVARAESEACNAELGRLNGLINAWHDAQEEEKRQIEQASRREVEALERIQQENQKQMEEAQRAILTAPSAKVARAAAQVSQRAAEAVQAATAQIAQIQGSPIPLPETQLAEGQSIRQEWDYEEPTVQELAALWTLHGEKFVKLEARRSELKFWLNSDLCPKDKDGKPTVGLRLKRVSSQRIRTTKQTALNV